MHVFRIAQESNVFCDNYLKNSVKEGPQNTASDTPAVNTSTKLNWLCKALHL